MCLLLKKKKLLFKASLYTLYCYPLPVMYFVYMFSQFVTFSNFLLEYFDEQKSFILI